MWFNIAHISFLFALPVLFWKWDCRLAVAYSYCLVCFLLMALSTCIAWYRRPAVFDLPDIGHDLLPQISTIIGWDAHVMCDNLLRFTVALTFGFIHRHAERSKILRRFFVVYGSVLALRSCTLLMTALPDPYFLCAASAKGSLRWSAISWHAVLVDVFALFGPSEKNSMTCGDLIFSGHTVLFVLCALTWHTYYRCTRGVNPAKLLIWMVSVLGTVLLLVTRMHWTIDIALAYYITITSWNFYHSVCRALDHRHYMKPVIYIDGVLIYPFIAWLERGVDYATFQKENEEARKIKK